MANASINNRLRFRNVSISLTIGLFWFIASAGPLDAQEYLFSIPQTRMLVTILPDASAKIEYEFVFQNTPSGHPIDIVDIGVPHSGYDLHNIRAWIGESQLHDIRPSTVVHPGFEVHLDSGTIPPNGRGRLRVAFTMPNMVYQDTTRKDYASLRITPTWFGEQYVAGTTQLQIAIQLPKSVQPAEVLHQGTPFTGKAITDNGTMVGWSFRGIRLTGEREVAVSFPKRDMQRVITQSPFDLLIKWFSESPQARLILGGVYVAFLGFLFFRFSGGTGFSIFFVLAAGSCVLFAFHPVLHLLAMPIVVMLIGLNEWSLDRRKTHYMPPILQSEGGGIKRGLTAPEAAVLLELPVAKALSLVIFGMLKRGVLLQKQADPLMVEVVEAFQLKSELLLINEQDRATFYHDAAVKSGIAVHDYEQSFLFLLQSNPSKPVRDICFSVPMKLLIEGTAARMKGFNLKETKEYYRSIIHRAMEQAAAIGDIPQQEREQTIDRNFEWILMDNGFPTIFGYGPYRPIWMRGPTVGLPGGGGMPSVPSAPNIPGSTSFGDVASSFAGWAENTMGSLASAISPGSLNMSNPSGGFLDLRGADHVAGDFLQALAQAATSGDGGGGLGGGGGCACAGCACACACAGGGR
jgi:hypothetical protein